MITPNGKRRNQVNQGGFKNESIWDSSWFHGVAGDMTKQAIAATAPMSGTETEMPPAPENDLDRAMADGNSMKMNPSKIPQPGEMKKNPMEEDATQPASGGPGGPAGNSNPENWNFDPETGEPLAGLSGEEAYQQAYKVFSQHNLSVEVRGDLHGAGWQVIITPGKGKAVSKGA